MSAFLYHPGRDWWWRERARESTVFLSKKLGEAEFAEMAEVCKKCPIFAPQLPVCLSNFPSAPTLLERLYGSVGFCVVLWCLIVPCRTDQGTTAIRKRN